MKPEKYAYMLIGAWMVFGMLKFLTDPALFTLSSFAFLLCSFRLEEISRAR